MVKVLLGGDTSPSVCSNGLIPATVHTYSAPVKMPLMVIVFKSFPAPNIGPTTAFPVDLQVALYPMMEIVVRSIDEGTSQDIVALSLPSVKGFATMFKGLNTPDLQQKKERNRGNPDKNLNNKEYLDNNNYL